LIAKAVDDIWGKYDTGKKGVLDKETTKRFVKHTLRKISESGPYKEFNDD
jgi:hypothetical protein